jgi:hypothetical protein
MRQCRSDGERMIRMLMVVKSLDTISKIRKYPTTINLTIANIFKFRAFSVPNLFYNESSAIQFQSEFLRYNVSLHVASMSQALWYNEMKVHTPQPRVNNRVGKFVVYFPCMINMNFRMRSPRCNLSSLSMKSGTPAADALASLASSSSWNTFSKLSTNCVLALSISSKSTS